MTRFIEVHATGNMATLVNVDSIAAMCPRGDGARIWRHGVEPWWDVEESYVDMLDAIVRVATVDVPIKDSANAHT